jgi:hypothetical protein
MATTTLCDPKPGHIALSPRRTGSLVGSGVYSKPEADRTFQRRSVVAIGDQEADSGLLIRPDEVLGSVRAELVETLRQAQGERFIFHRAEAISKISGAVHRPNMRLLPRAYVAQMLLRSITNF